MACPDDTKCCIVGVGLPGVSLNPRLKRVMEGNVRIKSVTTFVLGTALLVAYAAPAMAQARPTTAPASSSTTSSDSSGQFDIGYSYLHLNSASAPVGFDANYSKDVSTMSNASLGILGDFSFNHFSGGSTEFFDGGVKFGFKGNPKFTPYALVTGGLGHATGSSNFTLDFGGGVTMPLNGKAFDLFVQADIPVVFATGGHFTGFRLNVGIAIPLK
jgi:hypothetical protein